MRIEDLILVSVDDHVVEPPDMFKQHIPQQFRDRAPRLVHKKDGTDVWVFEGRQVPNIGVNAVAGRPPDPVVRAQSIARSSESLAGAPRR